MNLGTIESKVKVDGLAQFGDDLKKVDATMEAFARQTNKRFARVETDVKAAAKAMGMSAQDMQSQLDRAMKSISADTATKSLERMARQMGLTRQETEQWARKMGLSESTITSLTNKLYLATNKVSDFSMKAMTMADVLSLINNAASMLGLSVGVYTITGAIKDALNMIDDYKKTVIGIAATLTDTSTKTGDQLKQVYQNNLAYATQTYDKVQLAAAKFFASGKEMTEAWQILTNKGIRLTSDQDINNLGIIVDKIKMVTQGQESSIQIAQEIRSTMSGQARAGDQLAMLLEDRLGPKWKDLLADQIKSGDVLEFIASQIKGVGVATEDIQNTLSSQLSTQETLIGQIVRSGFKEMYEDSVTAVRNINTALEQHKTLLSDIIGKTYSWAKELALVAASLGPLYNTLNLIMGGKLPTATQLVKQGENERSSSSTSVSGDANSIEPTFRKYSDVLSDVKNSLKDDESFLKTPLSDQIGDITTKYQRAYDIMRKYVDSGKLDQAGLASTGKLWVDVLKSQGVEVESVNKKLDSQSKKGQSAANAAARYSEQASGYLQQAQDQYNQLLAQWSGDTLGSKIAQIDKKYDQLETSIRKSMIGARGATEEARKALEQLESNRTLEKQIAEMEAWKKSMQDAASIQSKIGQLSGNPQAIYNGQMTSVQVWKQGQDQKTLSIGDDEERYNRQAEIDKIYNLEHVNAVRQSYKDISGVSEKYWDAEKEYIQQHLGAVKSEASSELAYKIYAAQQWDEYNKALLEKEIAYAGSFATTFAAKWSLAFGSYKSDITKSHEEWGQMSDAIITLNQGLISSVSGGFGDFFRKIKDGTATTADLFDYMCSRMYDAVANFVEKTINDQLSRLAQSLGGSVGSWLGNILGIGSSTSYSASDVTSAMASTGISPWTAANAYASGGAFPAGTSLPLGTIIDKPTFFSTPDTGFHAFASGGVLNNVAGEKGPEVLFPLTSMGGKQGILGRLDMSGSSTQQTIPNISITLENRSGQEMKATKGKTVSNQDGLFVTYFLDLVARNSNNLRTGMQGLLGA